MMHAFASSDECECPQCFPLFAYGDTPTNDSSSSDDDQVDQVALFYGLPPLPTRKQLRQKRMREGVPKLTPFEAHERQEHWKYKVFVNRFEAQMAEAREVNSESVIVNALVAICHGIIGCWNIMTATLRRPNSKVDPAHVTTQSDRGYSTDTESSANASLNPHVVINFNK